MNLEMPETIAIDFDGVLTDGKHFIDHDGKKFYSVHSRDNSSLQELVDMGYRVVIITANSDEAIKRYCERRKIEYIYSRDKDIEATHAVGDSTFDLGMLTRAKYKYCPSDADEMIKRIPGMIVLPCKGGHGVIEHLIAKL